MIKRGIVLLPFIILYTNLFGQSTIENDRIAELYDLILDMKPLYGYQATIYDYKLKGKKVIKDSSLIAQFNIVNNLDVGNKVEYDTLNNLVTMYEIVKDTRVPRETYLINTKHQVLEHSIINSDFDVLSRTFYEYNDGLLISEKAYTGYAYLENPRMISQITYSYDKGGLSEKKKKYSLNGEHWIQTWVTKFDEQNRKILLIESEGEKNNSYSYSYNKDGLIEKILIVSDKELKSTKVIEYYPKGLPKSILWYIEKNKKPIRMTKYFYR